MTRQGFAPGVRRGFAQGLMVMAVLTASAIASAQTPSLPRAQWLANARPMFMLGLCADTSPFRKVYKESVASCPARVGELFDECATRTPEVVLPETIVGVEQAKKYGSIVGECISAHYMGGAPLEVFNAIQAVTNEMPEQPASTPPVGMCASPRPDTVSTLSSPYAGWASIECDDAQKMQFLAPADGYVWTVERNGGFSPQHKSQRSYRISAAGPVPIFAFGPLPDRAPRHEFVKQVPSLMSAQQLDGVNALLPEGTAPYQTIHQLDLNTSRGLIYSFFIYIRDASPEWVVACVNYQCGPRAIIRVTRG